MLCCPHKTVGSDGFQTTYNQHEAIGAVDNNTLAGF